MLDRQKALQEKKSEPDKGNIESNNNEPKKGKTKEELIELRK
jgi:hypothetical protein